MSLGRLLSVSMCLTRIRRGFSTVLGLLLSNRISIGKATELLGLRVDDLWILMYRLGIGYSILDEEEVEEELDAYKEVLKSNT